MMPQCGATLLHKLSSHSHIYVHLALGLRRPLHHLLLHPLTLMVMSMLVMK
jgi:hypothetical protein